MHLIYYIYFKYNLSVQLDSNETGFKSFPQTKNFNFSKYISIDTISMKVIIFKYVRN